MLGAMAPEHSDSAINPQTLLLDTFFPGFSVASSVLTKSLGIDISIYLPILLLAGVFSWASFYVNNWIWNFIDQYLMSTVDIRVDDEMYNMVMAWIATQAFAQKSRRFIANTDLSSRAWNLQMSSWNDDEDDEDESSVEFDENGVAVVGSGKNKDKKVRFTPSFGLHYFFYKSHLLIFRRTRDTHQISFGSVSEYEEISLQSFGRNPNVLKELLAECRLQFLENDMNKTIIYRGGHKSGNTEIGWNRCAARVSRPFSTVVLDETVKQSLVDDMREYLHQNTRRWYSNRGIPYRRGYLFYGPPGSGKSSLSLAIAGYFKLKIYVVSLNSGSISEETLGNLFAELPKQCVVLLEDIDTAGMTQSRKTDEPETPKPLFTDKGTPIMLPGGATSPPANKISLSALLNILDGVASQEGRILIMTTNHIEKLDEALIRPGRVDMKIKFDLANTEMITTIFRAIFTTLEGDVPASEKEISIRTPKPLISSISATLTTESLKLAAETQASDLAAKKAEDQKIFAMGEKIAQIIPSMKFSPAEIQGFLLKHKCKPERAMMEASAWVEKTLEEKRKKDDKDKEKQEKKFAMEEETWEEKMWAVGVGL